MRNLFYGAGGQIITLLCNFISRKIFIMTLGSEYLGLNAVFSNLLSMLSLAELGVGSAIAFALYKPLAEKDTEQIKSIMDLFRRVYWSIGGIIAFLGICLTPFLGFFTGETSIPMVPVLFLLYVANSAVSYFYSYKGTLINADQQKYIVTINNNVFKVILDFVQCIILILTHNFLLFLVGQLLVTICSNYVLSRKAEKMYPYLRDRDAKELDRESLQSIIKNVSAMVFHKLGNVLVNATDSLIITKFVNLAAAGLYSNYQMIVNAIQNFEWLIYYSVTASVGNYNVMETDEKKYELFRFINFVNYLSTGFCSLGLWVMFQPFISAFYGENMILSQYAVFLICLRYFVTGMRKSVLTFRDAMGLYWYDRYKSLFESGINLGVSILLATRFGIVGVLWGTVISTVTTCFWIEPYVLYKYGLKRKLAPYFGSYAVYALKTLLVAVCITLSIHFLDVGSNVLQIFVNGVVLVVEFLLLTWLLNLKNPHMNRLFGIGKRLLNRTKI